MSKEANALDYQARSCYPELAEDEIGQQSADQLPGFHLNSVEFDGIRMQVEMLNFELEQEEKS